MAEMILKCGAIVFVDKVDLARLSGFAWCLDRKGYPVRKAVVNGVKGSSVLMHRVILDAKAGQVVDHVDRNPLNNQSSNLRFVSLSNNSCNRTAIVGKTSKHKGVSWCNTRRRWVMQICVSGKKYYGGRYSIEDEAAHAYNKAAILLHGEYATLNPIGFDKDSK